AGTLADAENVRYTPDLQPAPTPPVNVAAILEQAAADFGALDRATALLRSSSGIIFQKTAIDLVAAQTWRTNWLLSATAYIVAGRGTHAASSKKQALVVLLDRAVHGCGPALRLLGAQLHTDITVAGSVALDEHAGELAVTGALLATLSLLEGVDQ